MKLFSFVVKGVKVIESYGKVEILYINVDNFKRRKRIIIIRNGAKTISLQTTLFGRLKYSSLF
jgi:hypothetical protein